MKSKPIQTFTTPSILNSLRLINIDTDASWGRLQYNRLREILKDAESCIRLSSYEEEFVASLRERMQHYGKIMRVSPKQWDVIDRIESKVYAV